MQQRLTTADGNDRCAHRTKPVDSREHLIRRNRVRKIIEFIAIRAGEIAAANWNDVHQQGMLCGSESLGDHAPLAHLSMDGEQSASNFLLSRHDLCKVE